MAVFQKNPNWGENIGSVLAGIPGVVCAIWPDRCQGGNQGGRSNEDPIIVNLPEQDNSSDNKLLFTVIAAAVVIIIILLVTKK